VIKALLLALACLAAVPAAMAHGDYPAKHGGLMNEGGETSFELVARDRRVTLYVSDHGTDVPMKGAKGSFTVTRGTAERSTPLTPADANALRTTTAQRLLPGDRVKARVEMPDGSIAVGRFLVK
jgi:hypothetical protein